MEFDLNDFSREVYAVSVAHGWHDPEPTPAETIALIHSEWSEALQAYRNGADMHEIATELIDGCLRILDSLGANGYQFDWSTMALSPLSFYIPDAIAKLHKLTACACDITIWKIDYDMLGNIVLLVFNNLGAHGINPYQVMKEKHEYNKTRPYRHGGKKL